MSLDSHQQSSVKSQAHRYLMSSPQIDFIAGIASGVAGSFISHPLDTIKVRMQSGQTAGSSRIVPTIKLIYSYEGIRGFFKGVLSPIFGRTPISAIMFVTQGSTKRLLDRNSNWNHNLKEFISGGIAGFVYASIAFFFDLLKCRAQTSLDKQITYREEISRIILREGFKGFTLGYPAMVIRDIISFGFYFSIYDHSKSLLCPDQQQISFPQKLCAGGIAGALSWALGFPFDSLKVKMQTQQIPSSLIQGLKFVHQQNGLLSLYKGVHVQVLRAFPTTAVGITVFDYTRDYMIQQLS